MLVSDKIKFIKPSYFDKLLRIGSKNDGGYVIPADLIVKIDDLICLGVSDNWQFESDIKKINKNIRITAFDHSVGLRFFLRKLITSFIKLFILKNNVSTVYKAIKVFFSFIFFFIFKARFYKKKVVYKSTFKNEIDIKSVLKKPSKNILFKLDIEGGEYAIFKYILNSSDKINIIVVEFHSINKRLKKFSYLLKLALKNYVVAYVHANNFSFVADGIPDVLEITLVNKKFFNPSKCDFKFNPDFYRQSRPNNPNYKDIKLSFDNE